MLAVGVVAAVAIAIVLIGGIVYGVVFRGNRDHVKKVIFAGLSGSGKTALMMRLVSQTFLKTVTSQVDNEFRAEIGAGRFDLIDTPGAVSSRTEVMKKIRGADAVIFVIDADTAFRDINPIANFVYDILSAPEVISRRAPLLIALSKSELPGARNGEIVRPELEREMNKLRANRAGANWVHGGLVYLGDEGADFSFDQIRRNAVTFGEFSTAEGRLDPIRSFLAKLGS